MSIIRTVLTNIRLPALILSTLLLAGCHQSDEEAQYLTDAPITGDEAEMIYDYAYPLVLMQITQDLMFTVPFRPDSHPNQFIMFDELAKPKNQAVVLGNRNTLYCVGWVDLSKGPVIFEIPDMADRYYVMPLLDAWTNTFKSIGSRTTGQGAQKYLIASDDWQGEPVEGYETITSPTNMVWITGRIQADSKQDSFDAAKLQAQYKLMTYEQHTTGVDPFDDYDPDYAAWQVRKPVPYSLDMSSDDYYNEFFKSWPSNPALSGDTAILKVFAKAGIEPSNPRLLSELNSAVQHQLSLAQQNKQTEYLAAFYEGKAQTQTWIYNTEQMGTWGDNYSRRAYWGMWGLGANLVEDAVYGVSQLDSNLEQLQGDTTYKIHFEAGQTPPTNAFWSVTTYDNEGYLEKNDHDRYSLGSNHELAYNPDGSLDMVMSYEQPKDPSINWVPAPKDAFKVLLRIYWPKTEALDGTWVVPPIEKSA